MSKLTSSKFYKTDNANRQSCSRQELGIKVGQNWLIDSGLGGVYRVVVTEAQSKSERVTVDNINPNWQQTYTPLASDLMAWFAIGYPNGRYIIQLLKRHEARQVLMSGHSRQGQPVVFYRIGMDGNHEDYELLKIKMAENGVEPDSMPFYGFSEYLNEAYEQTSTSYPLAQIID